MFWFFKKGGANIESLKLKELDKIMKSSFYNVKQDITELSSWVKDVHSNHKSHASKLEDHDERLKRIENMLTVLLDQTNKKEKAIVPQKTVEEEQEQISLLKELLDENAIFAGLTSTHKELFSMIYRLQAQLGGNPVSFKSLASMAYADKEYHKIRSTISQYLNFLYQTGLIDKKRYGKEAFISLTPLGMSLMKNKIKEGLEAKNIKKANR